MLAMGFAALEGPSGVLRATVRCLCESGSNKVQAISGVGARRGRTVPAESTMRSDGPYGCCAPVGSTSNESTPGRRAGRAAAQQSTRTSAPARHNPDAKGREADVDLEAGIRRARPKCMIAFSLQASWPDAQLRAATLHMRDHMRAKVRFFFLCWSWSCRVPL